jgi:hypothetical protein
MFKNILCGCGPINDVLQLLLSTCGWVFHFAKHPPQGVPHMAGSLVHGGNFISKSKKLYTG